MRFLLVFVWLQVVVMACREFEMGKVTLFLLSPFPFFSLNVCQHLSSHSGLVYGCSCTFWFVCFFLTLEEMRALLATKRGAAPCLRAFHCPLRECSQLPFPDSLKFKLSVSNHIPFFSQQDSEENKGDYLTRTLQVTYNNVSDALH